MVSNNRRPWIHAIQESKVRCYSRSPLPRVRGKKGFDSGNLTHAVKNHEKIASRWFCVRRCRGITPTHSCRILAPSVFCLCKRYFRKITVACNICRHIYYILIHICKNSPVQVLYQHARRRKGAVHRLSNVIITITVATKGVFTHTVRYAVHTRWWRGTDQRRLWELLEILYQN